jgi:hypothetical protein
VVFRQAAAAPAKQGRNFVAPTVVATLSGDWRVSFDPRWGGPAVTSFGSLTDWTKNADAGVKYYSGQAVYYKMFNKPADLPAGGRVLLDLGDVRDVAVVRLNGRELATLWLPPWRVDVTATLQAGENTLEIIVINPWNNRLVGDAKLPAAERRTSLTLATVKPATPLIPAGLLGPVTLQLAAKEN